MCIRHSLAASRAQVHPPPWRAINVRPPASLLTDNQSCASCRDASAFDFLQVECSTQQKTWFSLPFPFRRVFMGLLFGWTCIRYVFLALWKTWLEFLTASVQICIQTRLPPITTTCINPRNRLLYLSPPPPTAAIIIITSRSDSAPALHTVRSALTSTRTTTWTASSTASAMLSAHTTRTAPALHQLPQMLVNMSLLLKWLFLRSQRCYFTLKRYVDS